jgi:flagellar assembly factor FliW
MNFHSDRFGDITIDPKDLIEFPNGLIGFPNERHFILLRQRGDSPVAWLHSATSSALAFPVVSLEGLTITFAESDILAAATEAGIGGALENMSVMLVFAAPGKGISPTVNLIAPVIVSAETRTGAQVLFEGTNLSACEPLAAWLRPPPAATNGLHTQMRARRTTETQVAADEP